MGIKDILPERPLKPQPASMPYRLTISTVFGFDWVGAFERLEGAEQFADDVKKNGLSTAEGLTLAPRAIGAISIEGPHGVTIRPAPAVAFPKATVGREGN